MRPRRRPRAGSASSNQAEQRITQLHNQFKITPAQQSQWDAFAQAMRDDAQHMDQVFAQQGNPQNGSALDDMRAYAAITEAHAQDVQHLLPAFETLYNAMSPEQKRVADNVFHQYARQESRRTAAR